MPEVSLAELVRLASSAAEGGSGSPDSERYIYVRIGNDGKRGLNTEIRTTVEGKELMLDLDERGHVHGIEFWT
jgi:uncharacterized protein YuzE